MPGVWAAFCDLLQRAVYGEGGGNKFAVEKPGGCFLSQAVRVSVSSGKSCDSTCP